MKCANCGVEFEKTIYHRKYCSWACRKEANRRRAKLYYREHKEQRDASAKKWQKKNAAAINLQRKYRSFGKKLSIARARLLLKN